MQTAIVDEEKRRTQMRALEKFLAQVKKNVITARKKLMGLSETFQVSRLLHVHKFIS